MKCSCSNSGVSKSREPDECSICSKLLHYSHVFFPFLLNTFQFKVIFCCHSRICWFFFWGGCSKSVLMVSHMPCTVQRMMFPMPVLFYEITMSDKVQKEGSKLMSQHPGENKTAWVWNERLDLAERYIFN